MPVLPHMACVCVLHCLRGTPCPCHACLASSSVCPARLSPSCEFPVFVAVYVWVDMLLVMALAISVLCVCVCHIQKPEDNFVVLFHLCKGSRDGTQGSGL